jgi:glucose/arabinose dehydrogenase
MIQFDSCCLKSITPNRLLFFIFFLMFYTQTIAQPTIALTPVITTGLSSPIQFVSAGDGTNRVFIVQQGGTIKAYDASFNFLADLVTVSNVNAGGERGLLSMAFHPNYASNGFFYVYYTNTAGDLELARYHISGDANVADPASKVILITIPHPTNSNHNGGELHFGADGYLYLSTGDGGGGGDVPNNAQNTAVLLGKILRFDVNTSNTSPYYTIPAGNPFGNEIYDLGLRNPFRWSFDRLTNDMWIGDVGQDSFEEINFRPAAATAGVNYGWHCYEANNTYNTTGCGPIANYVFPVYTYPTQNPAAAITGGVVYRGTQYPSLQGYNISADFYSGTFYLTIPNGSGGWLTTTQVLATNNIADFGETENGEVYAVSLTGNSVYRVDAPGPLPVTLTAFTGAPEKAGVALQWQTAAEQNIRQYDVEYSLNGSAFSFAGTVRPALSSAANTYRFLHAFRYSGTIFYRLKILNTDGSYTYSNVIQFPVNNTIKNVIAPTIVSNGIINAYLDNTGYRAIEVVSSNGSIVAKQNIAGQSGQIKIPVNKLPTGVYMVKFIGDNTVDVEKIIIH